MTATIEELEAALNAAIKVRHQAENAVVEAKTRLQDARNAASGILGHVLEYTTERGWGDHSKKITRRILVERISRHWKGGDEARGRLILASGEVGVRRGEVAVADAKDLGPYAAPEPRKEERT
jgi:hypothetical protein